MLSRSAADCSQLLALKANTQASGVRLCVWLTGSVEWTHQQAKTLLADETSVVYIGNDTPCWAKRCFTPQHTARLLGQEARFVVYNAFSGVNPDTLGQVAGLVERGGWFVLLTAPPEHALFWQDPEKERLCVTPEPSSAVGNIFLQHTKTVLETDVAVVRWDQHTAISNRPRLPNQHALPNDIEQKQAVEQLYQQALSGVLRTGVLTAARGRGKSAALGLLAQRLGQLGWRVGMTAPAAETLVSVRHYAGEAVPTFYSVLEAAQPENACDLLLVDEAAMIPVKRLKQMVQAHPRIIFATTTEGYEGTGQGFALRFLPWLECHMPTLQLRLHTPMRWHVDDPLEALFNRWLLLNAAKPDSAEFAQDHPLTIQQINRADLLANQPLLSAIFGLLINAHYRTTPGDLRVMLDSPNVSIWIASQDGNLLGTCLMATEGELPAALNQAIWEGTRRPRGHLLPQLLVAQEGHLEAGVLRFARVVRIAVADNVRQHGIARQLLSAIETFFAAAGVDFIGASFAANEHLLPFWQTQGYVGVRAGTAVDANSGSVAVAVLKPLHAQREQLLAQWQCYYQTQLPYLLDTWLKTVDADIRKALDQHKGDPNSCLSDDLLWSRVVGFADTKRSPESSAFCLMSLLKQYPSAVIHMPEPLAMLLRDFVQTPHHYETLIQRHGLSGRKALIQQLRWAAKSLCNAHSITSA